MKTVTRPRSTTRTHPTARPLSITRRFLSLAPAAICAVALVGACASDPASSGEPARDTGTSSRGMPAYDASGDTAPADEAPRKQPEGKSISLSKEALSGLDAFVNRRATLFADTIEVDLSRSPFFAGMSLSVNPDTVDRAESKDPESGVITIVLQARGEQAPSLTTMPIVRFGDGLELIAQDRIALRFWPVQNEARPIHFKARAVGIRGQAVFGYQDDLENARKGREVLVTAAIRKRGDVYGFAQAIEATP